LITNAKAELVGLLEKHLEMARAGQIAGLVIVATGGPDQISFSTSGALPSTLLAGCEAAKQALLAQLFAPPQRPTLAVPPRT
jgi:hypothetical protein